MDYSRRNKKRSVMVNRAAAALMGGILAVVPACTAIGVATSVVAMEASTSESSQKVMYTLLKTECRDAPDKKADVIGIYEKDTAVVVSSIENGWGHTKYGYVEASSLSLEKDGKPVWEASLEEPEGQGSQDPGLAGSGTEPGSPVDSEGTGIPPATEEENAGTEDSTEIPYVEEQTEESTDTAQADGNTENQQASNEETQEKKIMYATSDLNCRVSPWGDVLGYYPENAPVIVSYIKDGWAKTENGWAYAEYLTEKKPDKEPVFPDMGKNEQAGSAEGQMPITENDTADDSASGSDGASVSPDAPEAPAAEGNAVEA